MQGQFANCSLLVFSLPQVCSRSSSPHLCSVRKSYHVMPYLTSCPPRALTSYTTSSAVLQEFPVLHYLTSCPTRAPTPYTTSPVVLQELPHPTQPHQSSYKSSHILHYLISCPARDYTTSSAVLQALSHPTPPHQLSSKCFHILHYLISCPARAPRFCSEEICIRNAKNHCICELENSALSVIFLKTYECKHGSMHT